jgi:hypothetical protein
MTNTTITISREAFELACEKADLTIKQMRTLWANLMNAEEEAEDKTFIIGDITDDTNKTSDNGSFTLDYSEIIRNDSNVIIFRSGKAILFVCKKSGNVTVYFIGLTNAETDKHRIDLMRRGEDVSEGWYIGFMPIPELIATINHVGSYYRWLSDGRKRRISEYRDDIRNGINFVRSFID